MTFFAVSITLVCQKKQLTTSNNFFNVLWYDTTSNVKLVWSMCCKYIPLYISSKTGMVCFSGAREGPLFLIKLTLVDKIELE